MTATGDELADGGDVTTNEDITFSDPSLEVTDGGTNISASIKAEAADEVQVKVTKAETKEDSG